MKQRQRFAGAASLCLPARAGEQALSEAAADAPASDARIAKLRELAELREAGILTKVEFQAKKQYVLAGG